LSSVRIVHIVRDQSKSYFTTGGLQPISSSWRQAPWDLSPIILFSNWTFAVIVLMQHLYVVYNCCWPSPVQSFLGPSPAGLMTTFYCLRFETPPTWRARSLYIYPPRSEWLGYTSRHWVPFSSSADMLQHLSESHKELCTYIIIMNIISISHIFK
jgi:hypothetical protein